MESSVEQFNKCRRILNEKYKLIPCSKCGGKMVVEDYLIEELKPRQGYFESTPKICIVCKKCKDTIYFKIEELLKSDIN